MKNTKKTGKGKNKDKGVPKGVMGAMAREKGAAPGGKSYQSGMPRKAC